MRNLVLAIIRTVLYVERPQSPWLHPSFLATKGYLEDVRGTTGQLGVPCDTHCHTQPPPRVASVCSKHVQAPDTPLPQKGLSTIAIPRTERRTLCASASFAAPGTCNCHATPPRSSARLPSPPPVSLSLSWVTPSNLNLLHLVLVCKHRSSTPSINQFAHQEKRSLDEQDTDIIPNIFPVLRLPSTDCCQALQP